MKRAVLSIIIVWLSFVSISQVPESLNHKTILPITTGGIFPYHSTNVRTSILSIRPTDSSTLINEPDFFFGPVSDYRITNWNTNKLNIINGWSNNSVIYLPSGEVPDLTGIMGNHTFSRIASWGFYYNFTGRPSLISGNYFVFTNKLIGNFGGVFQDMNGNICMTVPGWKSGQYIPLMNSTINSSGSFGRPGFYYFGTFPVRKKYSSKSGK